MYAQSTALSRELRRHLTDKLERATRVWPAVREISLVSKMYCFKSLKTVYTNTVFHCYSFWFRQDWVMYLAYYKHIECCAKFQGNTKLNKTAPGDTALQRIFTVPTLLRSPA